MVVQKLRSFFNAPSMGYSGVSSYADNAIIDERDFQPVEYGTYMATSTAIYACISLRASELSALDLKAYKVKGEARDLVTSGPLVELLQKVNPFWTFRRLLELTETSLGLWGEYFWFVERGDSGMGTPKEIWGVRPDQVKVVSSEKEWIKGFIYTPQSGAEPQFFSRNEVIWHRYINPMDPRRGLSPIATIRATADLARAATKSNAGIFRNGLQIGGLISPKQQGQQFTAAQAKELEDQLTRRFKGQDKAHRWGVLRFDANFQPLSLSPKDAEFLGMQKWSLEEIARAYKIPQDLIGGQRTYENVKAAERGLWTHCLLPETRFLADELTEQLLPMFPGQADLLEFDTSEVEDLNESEAEKWQIAQAKIQQGVLLQNEYRESEGLDPVDWGNVWWAPINLTPIGEGDPIAALPEPVIEEEEEDDEEPVSDDDAGEEDDPDEPATGRAKAARQRPEYGSRQHSQHWMRSVARTDPWEQQWKRTLLDLFRRQEQAVLDRLTARSAEAVAADPFDQGKWTKTFRIAGRSLTFNIVQDAGDTAASDISGNISFDVYDPKVSRFIEQQSQRFAQSVTETTWNKLQKNIRVGVEKGETISDISKRVNKVFKERRDNAEVIARTETMTAYNGGQLASWQQSGVVTGKEWSAALDQRTRASHSAAHGTIVPINDDFTVGSGKGPAPGSMGAASENIQCRCTMLPVIDEDELDELDEPETAAVEEPFSFDTSPEWTRTTDPAEIERRFEEVGIYYVLGPDGQKVSVRGMNAQQLKIINEEVGPAMLRMKQRGLEHPTTAQILSFDSPQILGEDFTDDHTAVFDRRNIAIGFNSNGKHWRTGPIEDGWYSSNNPGDIFVHESAHARHAQWLEENDLDFDDVWEAKLTKEEKARLTQKVSRYSALDPTEAVAEIYTGAYNGQVYDDDVWEIYEKYNGPRDAVYQDRPRRAQPISWKPQMSRTEAEQWAQEQGGDAWDKPLYHYTSEESAVKIKDTGFQMSNGVYGTGVYSTAGDDPAASSTSASSTARRLEIVTSAKVKDATTGLIAAAKDIRKELKASGIDPENLTEDEFNAGLYKLENQMLHLGYGAIRFKGHSGGTWTMILDPEKVTVVDDIPV